MFKFEYGKSYFWLFGVFFAVFFVWFCMPNPFDGIKRFGALILPVFGAVLLINVLRSGVALDSWWRATYVKGGWQYRACLVAHAILFFWFSVFAYIVIVVL
jgi:hypothetical protein